MSHFQTNIIDSGLIKNERCHWTGTFGRPLHSSSYTRQTSRMGNLINDLENNTRAAEDVATLNATEWLNTMKTAYQNFVSLNEQRLAELEDEPDYTTVESRKEVRAALTDLFDYADVMYKILPDGTYEQLAGEINPLIDQTMQIVRYRRSKKRSLWRGMKR